MEKIVYGGWPNCYRLTNGCVELIVTGDVGPRIIRFGFCDGENVFFENPGDAGLTGGTDWRLYGGHRLWHAPEARPRTYAPDNSPVTFSTEGGIVRATQPIEPTTGIQKQIDLALDTSEASVTVTHRLINTTLWAIDLAPWALSVMAGGGIGIIPLPPRGLHQENLLPTSSLALWAYTDLADPRWTWGTKYILLRQDASAKTPQKIGISRSLNWAAYVRNGTLFVKQIEGRNDAPYPDMGSSIEMFTNSDMLEVETLGSMVKLDPGAAVEHVERWSLFRDVPMPASDDDVERHVLPLITIA